MIHAEELLKSEHQSQTLESVNPTLPEANMPHSKGSVAFIGPFEGSMLVSMKAKLEAHGTSPK